jgi:hypothetical protein
MFLCHLPCTPCIQAISSTALDRQISTTSMLENAFCQSFFAIKLPCPAELDLLGYVCCEILVQGLCTLLVRSRHSVMNIEESLPTKCGFFWKSS